MYEHSSARLSSQEVQEPIEEKVDAIVGALRRYLCLPQYDSNNNNNKDNNNKWEPVISYVSCVH